MSVAEIQPALHVDRFCEVFGISRATFWKYVSAGLIRTISIGKRRLVPGDEALRIQREGIATLPNPPKKSASAA